MGVDATTQTFLDKYSGNTTRAAFPGYRVFIFGHEVTDDVIDVRVSHSGGSAERSAGTCSFSIVNPNNKYTLTYADMLYVGKMSAAYTKIMEEDVLPKEVLDDINAFRADYIADLALQTGWGGQRKKITQDDLVELAEQREAEYARLAAEYSETSKECPFSATRLAGFPSKTYGAGAIKAKVVEEKLVFTSDIKYDPDTNLNKLENRTILNYPMQQGDCIFHPNDPVRIAFRDPFDPRIWYWMFTGFMDAWTENQGENKDSVITINCTDVTKMARYTYIQLGVGLADPNIESIVSSLREESGSGVQFFKELFASFTMQEVLETLFFGTVSALTNVEDAAKAEIRGMSDAAVTQYLAKNWPETVDPESVKYKASPEDRYSAAMEKAVEDRKQLITRAGQLAPISVPAPYMQGVSKGAAAGYTVFKKVGPSTGATKTYVDVKYDDTSAYVVAKRWSSAQGVSAYFYGGASETDLSIGMELPSLFWYNEVLHHRVRAKDLVEMALDSTEFDVDFGERPASEIIDLIGKNKTKFPVGHGRVFYTTRSRFADGEFGRSIIDRSFSGSSGLFSTFKDMLSYIYDMAERADFRFYATPKGDFVFELPFYDFNPKDFTEETTEGNEWKTEQVNSTLYNDKEITFSSLDLVAIGFLRDYTSDMEAQKITDTGKYDYTSCFTIEREEQVSFSNTFTDNGVFTVFRCKPNLVMGNASLDGWGITSHVWVPEKGGIPMLGVRVTDTDTWGFIASMEEAEAYAALTMARVNAEAKNVSVSTLPKFGLMVNRPLFWRERNYYANIVSLQHSVVWNSSADTTVNMNSIRGWGGEVDTQGYPIHRHFSGTDLPFSMGEMTKQANKTQNTQSGS